MRRRDFLVRTAALAGAAATLERLLERGERLPAAALHSPARPAPLAAVRGAEHGALLRRALRRIGALTRGECAGRQVLLKPSLAWDRAPEEGANVRPEVLAELLRMLLEAGASRVVICDRTALRADEVHARSGAAEVVRAIADPRIELRVLTEEDFVPLTASEPELPPDLAAALTAHGWRVPRALLDADLVLNVATARVHPTRRVSLGMANLLGLVGGARSDARWRESRDSELAVLTAVIAPDLTVLDATRAVVRNGPAGRGAVDVEPWDTLVVSRDPVAVEASGARLFGIEPDALPWIAWAERLGLGSTERGRREVRA